MFRYINIYDIEHTVIEAKYNNWNVVYCTNL